jgi:hypothetical protein
MSLHGRALAIAASILLMLGVAGAQDEGIQKMVGRWQGKVDLREEPERTLVIKSVRQEREGWIASIDYGPTGKSASAFEARIEREHGAPTMTFAMSTTSKVELQLFSERELRGVLKVADGTGSWVTRKLSCRRPATSPDAR